MNITPLLFSGLCCACFASDRSDRLPDFNKDNVTNNNTITITNQMSPRRSHPTHAGQKHPKVEAAHEILRDIKEDDDFVTCCCFFKIKKPLRS